MLGEHPGRAAFKAIGAGILGGVGGVVGNVVPVVGGIIGGLAGGVLGDMLGGALFDFFFSKKGSRSSTEYRNEGGMIGEGKSRRKLTEPPPERPKAITFNQSGEGPFASKTAADLIRDENIDLSKLDYFGPILALSAKILTGERPENSDYKNASLGINLLFKDGFKSGELVGNVDVSTGINLAKWIENSLIRRATKPLDGILERIKNFILNIGKGFGKGLEAAKDLVEDIVESVVVPPAQAKTSDDKSIGAFFNSLLGGSDGGGAYATGLKTGPRGSIGVGDEYHIDTKILKSLPMEQKIAMVINLQEVMLQGEERLSFQTLLLQVWCMMSMHLLNKKQHYSIKHLVLTHILVIVSLIVWIITSLQWVRLDLERVLRVQRFYLQQLMVVH